MQTDPNFGNYRIRIAETPEEQDKIVLLDFRSGTEIPGLCAWACMQND